VKIPKIIHQTWKDDNPPAVLKCLSDTWKQQHPDWEYRLWTDDMNRAFISRYFPEFLARYDSYPSGIYRVDAVRYLVLYKLGGVFVDMDFECFRNISPLLQHASCVFGCEPAEHCTLHEKDLIISNAFMGVAPHHPFLEQVYDELMNYSADTDHPNNHVLETTGPFMLSRVYGRYRTKKEVKLLEPSLIYPLTKAALAQMFSAGKPGVSTCRELEQAYALHYYYGTWWNKQWEASLTGKELLA